MTSERPIVTPPIKKRQSTQGDLLYEGYLPAADVELVSIQANVTLAIAADALHRHHGDIVNAIMDLTAVEE